MINPFSEYNQNINQIIQALTQIWSDNYVIFSKIYTKDENGNIKILEGLSIDKTQAVQIINSKNEVKKHNAYKYNQNNVKLKRIS